MWRATEKFDATSDSLETLRIIFKDIYPWSLIWKVRDEIRSTTDNAIYTYEKRLDELGVSVENSAKVRVSVLEDFVHDGRRTTRNLCEHLLKLIIMPPFNAEVRPACKHVLEPIANLVPDAMKDFLDVNRLFDEVLDDVIHHTLIAVIGKPDGESSEPKHREVDLTISPGPSTTISVTVAVEPAPAPAPAPEPVVVVAAPLLVPEPVVVTVEVQPPPHGPREPIYITIVTESGRIPVEIVGIYGS